MEKATMSGVTMVIY